VITSEIDLAMVLVLVEGVVVVVGSAQKAVFMLQIIHIDTHKNRHMVRAKKRVISFLEGRLEVKRSIRNSFQNGVIYYSPYGFLRRIKKR
jgi:hypothetical protein